MKPYDVIMPAIPGNFNEFDITEYITISFFEIVKVNDSVAHLNMVFKFVPCADADAVNNFLDKKKSPFDGLIYLEPGEYDAFLKGVNFDGTKKVVSAIKEIIKEHNGRITVRGRKNAEGKI